MLEAMQNICSYAQHATYKAQSNLHVSGECRCNSHLQYSPEGSLLGGDCKANMQPML